MVNHYVEPYVPPNPFLNRLKQHAEEALVHKTMESLKKIKINWPFLKEIRQTDNYPRYMKDLVANKKLTEDDNEVMMNPRSAALLQNLLPLKRIIQEIHWRKRFGNEYDDSEEFEDPDGCRENKENKILGTVLNKLHDEWFKGTDEDDDDLE
ncbi:hypothetical protein Tco_1114019 [Tanacetum coccineum]|uniref:Uncharacterized protein n=1 Tax=Tanacetum coccineum TaxID=301880 RepID=A0ABQ5IUZ8_9ASTR